MNSYLAFASWFLLVIAPIIAAWRIHERHERNKAQRELNILEGKLAAAWKHEHAVYDEITSRSSYQDRGYFLPEQKAELKKLQDYRHAIYEGQVSCAKRLL